MWDPPLSLKEGTPPRQVLLVWNLFLLRPEPTGAAPQHTQHNMDPTSRVKVTASQTDLPRSVVPAFPKFGWRWLPFVHMMSPRTLAAPRPGARGGSRSGPWWPFWAAGRGARTVSGRDPAGLSARCARGLVRLTGVTDCSGVGPALAATAEHVSQTMTPTGRPRPLGGSQQ